jgi:hypothetical protein
LIDRWKGWQVPIVDADTVRRRASVLVADNTSLAYEMAHLMRNVVTLNAPWYRRDVEHGLRFWSHPPGTQVDSPDELYDLDLLKLEWSPEPAEAAYGSSFNDGHAGMRAAAWLMSVIGSAR